MKKFFLLVFILTSPILFNSCDSDDDDNIDPLIGKWEVSKVVVNGITVPAELDDCDYKGTLEFSSNGNFTVEFFEENHLTGECVFDEIEDGTWVNKSSGTYEITVGGKSKLVEFTFEGDTFYLTEQDSNVIIKVFYKRV